MTKPELTYIIANYRFSDEESDSIIRLNGNESAALSAALWPTVSRWIGDAQASEGDLMRAAGFDSGYEKGYRDGRDDGYGYGYQDGRADATPDVE